MLKTSKLFKGSVIVTLTALALSSFAITSVFAKGVRSKAPATTATSTKTSTAMSTQMMESTWKSELSSLKFDNAVLGRVSSFIDNITRRVGKNVAARKTGRDDRLSDRLDDLFKEAAALLAKAQAVATSHAGFDANGAVTDQTQAMKSLQTLGADLDQLRGSITYRLEHLFG